MEPCSHNNGRAHAQPSTAIVLRDCGDDASSVNAQGACSVDQTGNPICLQLDHSPILSSEHVAVGRQPYGHPLAGLFSAQCPGRDHSNSALDRRQRARHVLGPLARTGPSQDYDTCARPYKHGPPDGSKHRDSVRELHETVPRRMQAVAEGFAEPEHVSVRY